MPDPDEAVAAALDAYQQRLLADDVPGHRTAPGLAAPLIQSLIERLARYADQRGLDVQDTLAELHEQRFDRSGPGPIYDFRLGAEVQFRRQRTATGAGPRYPPRRGFIAALADSPTGVVQCIVRIPGVSKGLPVAASELEPADPLLPLTTRTAGVVAHARDAESAIIHIAARVKRAVDKGLAADEQALTDLTQLTMRLGDWSGGSPENVMRHLYDHVMRVVQAKGRPAPSAAGRLAATEFPQDARPAPPPDSPPAPRHKPNGQFSQRKNRP